LLKDERLAVEVGHSWQLQRISNDRYWVRLPTDRFMSLRPRNAALRECTASLGRPFQGYCTCRRNSGGTLATWRLSEHADAT
jgi:hypothetical protein